MQAQGNPDVSIDRQRKVQEELLTVQQEAEKVSKGGGRRLSPPGGRRANCS